MKNFIIFLVIILFTVGCASNTKNTNSNKKSTEITKQETVQTLEKENKQECKINGYSCWKVIKIFTPASRTSEEEQNTLLKKFGLTIISSMMYRDGGSKSIQLSDGTRLWISNSLWDRSHNITVKLTDGRKITYDTEGHQIKPIK